MVISFIIGYNKGLLVVVDIFNTTRSVGDICSYMGSVIYSKRVYIWCQDSRRLWLRNNKKEFFFIKTFKKVFLLMALLHSLVFCGVPI